MDNSKTMKLGKPPSPSALTDVSDISDLTDVSSVSDVSYLNVEETTTASPLHQQSNTTIKIAGGADLAAKEPAVQVWLPPVFSTVKTGNKTISGRVTKLTGASDDGTNKMAKLHASLNMLEGEIAQLMRANTSLEQQNQALKMEIHCLRCSMRAKDKVIAAVNTAKKMSKNKDDDDDGGEDEADEEEDEDDGEKYVPVYHSLTCTSIKRKAMKY